MSVATFVVVGFILFIFFVIRNLFSNFERAFAARFLLCCKVNAFLSKQKVLGDIYILKNVNEKFRQN